MALAQFGKVTTLDDGDYLDGRLLLHGTRVNVKWPEGGSSTHVVEFHESVRQQRNKPAEVVPHLILQHKGVAFRYPLRGSDLMLARSD